MYTLYFSPAFERKLKKLVKNDPKFSASIQDKLNLLMDNPQHNSLRIHKLSGTENWSISITRSIRLVFSIRRDIVLCLDIGSHDEVY